jgi:ATP adenylyltransferase
MSDFVNLDNTARPDTSGSAYNKVIDKIKQDGVCPFCPENFLAYHKNPIIQEGIYWLMTNNMYPYENVKYHILILHKAHIETVTEISPVAWNELKSMVDGFTKDTGLLGGSLLMRFGDTRYTGATVRHLHANLISPDVENPNRKPIITRVG